MAITINWGQKIIHVPRADMTLIQETPTEIRELNLNTFRLALKDLEDSDEGMTFPDTHRHNTEVTVAGLTLARVVEIINGYTVTFEDGQYAVNLPGANSNVGDVVNVNQVSVRSFNSAGLTSSPDIEYASYQNRVTVDITSPWVGTTHPIGTDQKPVNNLKDALLIAFSRGLRGLHFLSDMSLEADCQGFAITGETRNIILTIAREYDYTGCSFEFLTLKGEDGGSNLVYKNCILNNLIDIQGYIINCALAGVIKFAGSNTNVYDSYSGRKLGYNRTVFDMNNLQTNLQIRRFSGGLVLRNFNSADNRVVIDFAPGALEIEPSCIAGNLVVHGEATIVDNGGPNLVRDFSSVISPESVADRTRVELTPELAEISHAKAVIANRLRINKETGDWVVYADDGTTPLYTGTIDDDGTFKDRVPA
jgi:hypothetical protein